MQGDTLYRRSLPLPECAAHSIHSLYFGVQPQMHQGASTFPYTPFSEGAVPLHAPPPRVIPLPMHHRYTKKPPAPCESLSVHPLLSALPPQGAPPPPGTPTPGCPHLRPAALSALRSAMSPQHTLPGRTPRRLQRRRRSPPNYGQRLVATLAKGGLYAYDPLLIGQRSARASLRLRLRRS